MTSKWMWMEALTFAQDAPNGAVRTGYALASYANSETGRNAYPSQATLAERLGITDRAVRQNLAWLKNAGWIVEERRGRRAGTQGITSSYSLTIPTGINVPIGNFPTGTFTSSQPENFGSPTGTELPPNQELTKEEPESRRKRISTPVPDDFEITDDMRSWALENKVTADLELATKKFVSWYAAKGTTFKDWDHAWRNWMLREQPPAATKKEPEPVSPWDGWAERLQRDPSPLIVDGHPFWGQAPDEVRS